MITLARSLYIAQGGHLVDRDKLDVKLQGRSLGNPRQLLVAISQSSRDGQSSLSSSGHTDKTLVPTSDDLSSSEHKGEGFTVGVGVKLFSVFELADVSGAISRSTNHCEVALTAFRVACHLWQRVHLRP